MLPKKGLPHQILFVLAIFVLLVGTMCSSTVPAQPEPTLAPPAATALPATDIPEPTLPPTAVPTETPAPVKLDLSFAPQEGDSIYFEAMTDQTIVQSIDGTEMTVEQTMGYGFRYTTAQVDADGNTWIEVTYEWIYVKSDSSGVVTEYDSANPAAESNELDDIYGAMIGKGFSIKVAPSGEVLEVQGLEDMMAEMWADMGITDPAILEQMQQMLGESFSDEGMKDQMGNSILRFPVEQVAIGDTWFVSTSTSILIRMTVEATYTLLEYEDGLATIGVSSVAYTDPEGEPMDMMGIQMFYDLSGTQEGTYVVDTETGWTTSANIAQAFEGEMRMVFGEEEMVVPMSITSTITIELIPDR